MQFKEMLEATLDASLKKSCSITHCAFWTHSVLVRKVKMILSLVSLRPGKCFLQGAGFLWADGADTWSAL